ncbi:MAG TPA: glycosyltransferase family 4 protein [Clostridiales bacterium]|nr:glycosyltransferase family 4 protein [Clostridiales bacterium]
MRVMEIIRSAEGGMKVHFTALVKGLAERGIEVTALCNFPAEDNKKLEHAGISVIPFSVPGNIRIFADIKCIIKMVILIHKIKPDIIHCHGFKAGILGRLAGWAAGVPLLYTVHNFADYGRKKAAKWLIKRFERWMGSKTDAIICVSHALKNSMSEETGIDEGILHVIYNSVPSWPAADGSNARKAHNIGDNCVIIGTVARLIPSKGIDILLKAAAGILPMYPSARILIAGSGPDEEKLKKMAQTLGVSEQVIFAGRAANIQDYYAAFDIFVLPTLSEGLGISVLEAMTFGLPVIATAVGGIPEWIVHGRNGCLVQPGNVFELRSALQSFLEDPVKAALYGRMAKLDVKNGLTEKDMVDKTLSVIKNIYNKKQTKTGEKIWTHARQK